MSKIDLMTLEEIQTELKNTMLNYRLKDKEFTAFINITYDVLKQNDALDLYTEIAARHEKKTDLIWSEYD